MRWNHEAEKAIARVPFFVRKRVSKRVEEEAIRSGDKQVRLEHVQRCKERYLHRMEDEVKGYQVETCFGPSGCTNRAIPDDEIAGLLEKRFSTRNWRAFLEDRVRGPLKMHHEFRVSVSDCPNACSRPQIADVGLLGAREPRVGGDSCSRCGECVEVCREGAVSLPDDSPGPVVDAGRCVFCGQCIEICPTGTLREARRGYRILAGGKLGRHPQLGRPVQGIYERKEALEWFDRCLDFTRKNSLRGERLGEMLNRVGWELLTGEAWGSPSEKGAAEGRERTEKNNRKKNSSS